MSESPDRLQPESPRTPRASNSKSGDWSPRTQTLPSHVLQERSRLRVSNGCCCPGCLSTQAGAVSPWASGQLSTPNKQLHLQPGQAHDTLEPPSQASSVRIWVHGPERTGHQAPPAPRWSGRPSRGSGYRRLSGDLPAWSLTTDPHYPYLFSKVPSNPNLDPGCIYSVFLLPLRSVCVLS